MTCTRTPAVALCGASKRFGATMAVDDVNLEIFSNEFFALLGPSGCGKTTLLRMIAGLEAPDRGRVMIGGCDMTAASPNSRPVNMVFQSYAIFPHMTVAQNIAYGLRVAGVARQEVELRVAGALEMVRLDGLGARSPGQLSGGQRQRVALARALVNRPKVLLLDEPLSALDAKLREYMRRELARLQERLGIAFVIVTHDQDEALSMAGRIAVMDQGRICQIGGPTTLYERPASRFVADFIGKVNLIEADVRDDRGGVLTLEAPGIDQMSMPHQAVTQKRVVIAIRPEKLCLSSDPPPVPSDGKKPISVAGVVRDIAYYGDISRVYVSLGGEGPELCVDVHNDVHPAGDTIRNQPVWVSWDAAQALILVR